MSASLGFAAFFRTQYAVFGATVRQHKLKFG
jgi:hypothetical protein